MASHSRTSRYQSLRRSGIVLTRMAPLVRFGLIGFGVSLFLDQVRPLISDAQFTWGERRVMGIVALSTIGGFVLASWIVGRLFRAASEMIDLCIDGAEAAWRTADLIELQLVPTLGRIANALERSPAPGGDPAPRSEAAVKIRNAIASGRWGEAERLVASFARDNPASAETRPLADELTQARATIVETLRARLDAARSANDADAVIDARDALTEHLRGEPLHELDRQVVRWLVGQVQRRARAGDVGADVAALAARVVDGFGDMAETASLRAALPGLRRNAGLCPRCARPYTGSGDACPRCLARGTSTTARPSNATPTSEDEP